LESIIVVEEKQKHQVVLFGLTQKDKNMDNFYIGLVSIVFFILALLWKVNPNPGEKYDQNLGCANIGMKSFLLLMSILGFIVLLT